MIEANVQQPLLIVRASILTNTTTISINLLVWKIWGVINYQNTNKDLDASIFPFLVIDDNTKKWYLKIGANKIHKV
jgi:hypothetical protein